jgi:hypothetical protein
VEASSDASLTPLPQTGLVRSRDESRHGSCHPKLMLAAQWGDTTRRVLSQDPSLRVA